MPTIYLVSANTIAEKPLRIEQEQRAILRSVSRSPSWTVRHAPAARVDDIISDLRRINPDIVHFSGHSSQSGRLILFDSNNREKEVARAVLKQLFAVMRERIRLVVLNACYSDLQAEAIRTSIGCVIGISHTLDDGNAVTYSGQFYDALVDGRSIFTAHEEALIQLAQVDPLHKPALKPKRGVDPRRISFVGATTTITAAPPAHTPPTTEKERAFLNAAQFYGVSADELRVEKFASPDGSFLCRFELVNITSTRGPIHSISWRFTSSCGLVGAPDLEPSVSASGIRWESDLEPANDSLEQLLKNLATLQGRFVLNPPIRPNRPRSLAWSMQIVNGDALTTWEYRNLYSSRQQQHVDGTTPSGGPSEWFSQLVWLPVKRLRISIHLPPSIPSRPEFRYFEWNGQTIDGRPTSQILNDAGQLRLHPDFSAPDARRYISWQRNLDGEDTEVNSLTHTPHSTLAIDFPTFGSHYSLDWLLPDPPLSTDMERLAAEAHDVRCALLAHRATPSPDIRSLFAALHREVATLLDAHEPSLTTSLMTWDPQLRRLVVVEFCRNDGQVTTAARDYWLPFGLGLAGACFRNASQAFRYKRQLDPADPQRPELYLPIHGAESHAILLSVPVDHPNLTEALVQEPDAQRCRQLIGVLSIGTRLNSSKLLNCCYDEMNEQSSALLIRLRDACQEKIDDISRRILESISGYPKPSGLIHQPLPDWRPPASKATFKVVAFDLDGTLLRGDGFVFSWELLWRSLDFDESVQRELRRRYRHDAAKGLGTIDRVQAYKRWCDQAVQHFRERGLTRSQIQQLSQSLHLTKNCRETLQHLRANGIVTALVSGGISIFLEELFPDFRDFFDFVFVNQLQFDPNGLVSGVNATAFDFEGKLDAVQHVCQIVGAKVQEHAVFIGDSFNDESIMVATSLAIAYPPNDGSAETVSFAIREDDLSAILPLILGGDGYSRQSSASPV